MTIQSEEFEYCKVKVNFSADSDLIVEKREEALEDLKKMNLKIPGFRNTTRKKSTKRKKKGRKNKQNHSFKNSRGYELALSRTYRKFLDEQVTKELVAEAYDETLYETRMKPIGYPKIVFANLGEESFDCELIFLKRPEFELKQYTGFKIPSPHIDEHPSVRAERSIELLRKRNADVEIYGEDDFVQEGDNLTINVTSTHDGNIIESLTREGMPYFVGQNTLEEFDKAIFGMKMGEERTFDIVFEDKEDLNEEVRGKRITFNVLVNAGTKSVPAELNDELAQSIGYESLDEMQKQILGTAASQIEKEKMQKVSDQILNRILELHDFEVPQDLILSESQTTASNFGTKFQDLSDSEKKMINEQSIKKIRTSLILDAIREDEPEANFSEQEIIETFRANIALNGGDANQILSSAQSDGTLFGLVAKLKDEATLQWLVNQSSIIDENKREEVVNG